MTIKVEVIAELVQLKPNTSIRNIGSCLDIYFDDEGVGVGEAGIEALREYEEAVSEALQNLGFDLYRDGLDYKLTTSMGYWGQEWAEGFEKLADILEDESHYVIACDSGLGVCCFTPLGVCCHESAVDALIAAAHGDG